MELLASFTTLVSLLADPHNADKLSEKFQKTSIFTRTTRLAGIHGIQRSNGLCSQVTFAIGIDSLGIFAGKLLTKREAVVRFLVWIESVERRRDNPSGTFSAACSTLRSKPRISEKAALLSKMSAIFQLPVHLTSLKGVISRTVLLLQVLPHADRVLAYLEVDYTRFDSVNYRIEHDMECTPPPIVPVSRRSSIARRASLSCHDNGVAVSRSKASFAVELE